MSIDDYFVRSLYEGDIYKTANLQNKLLAQYCPNDTAMKAEQQRIEKELVTFENKLWGIEEPDTTTATMGKKVEKKASRSAARPTVTRTPKAAEKSAAPKASARTTRQSSSPKSKAASSSQALSVRRQRR